MRLFTLKSVLLTSAFTVGIMFTSCIPVNAALTLKEKQNNNSVDTPSGDNNSSNEGDISQGGSNNDNLNPPIVDGNESGKPDQGENGSNNNNGNSNNGQNNNTGNGQGNNSGSSTDKRKRIEITRQPSNISIKPQNNVSITFDYKAYNLSPNDKVFFQWYKNGKTLYGQTEQTLTLNNVTHNDAGEYHALITIGFYAFYETTPAKLTIEDDSSMYDSIVFGGGTPSAYYNKYDKILKVDVALNFSKNGRLYFNGEAIKVEIYIGGYLRKTMYTDPGNNILFGMISGERHDFVNKEILVIATYDKLERREKVNGFTDIFGP
ncbi:immunoglobulin domain-containing protein [Malacoplasma iowae]|uniref:Immunoglobulin-like domain-containing protein n=2 Tax=Malacoplasma iowae TaxID=2116 RepID=A0A084U4X0_MALIO|nr:immunoglobulin domain-containing protein [Malacoplasma iowae]VEU62866.1 Uncharacterised protein [Mycoplasmopsis fermentans]EGZ30987.1 hypothetical protein GUU_04249 [Malacoplasma iowae 695]KFB08006.1 immunoglobulin-like domain-containing protein [Malacoplasma iowae DK-CPA]QHG89423.1 immunoglobulin domain-containing protein [Malacoplasma iowae 695]WPL35858.1 immunoglobulin domain-containing protein [Malacoplasma iowae]